MFIRAPRVGAVKTRLAAGLGAEAACAAYRRMIEHLMPAVHAAGLQVELRHTPDDAGAEVSQWQKPGWKLAPQGEGDLGARMERAFAASEAAGFRRTLLIGTDCPYLTASDLQVAAAALDAHDLVIGPAVDGGYWLIGLRKPEPALFRDIPWSSSDVLQATLERARLTGLTFCCLRELSDIDTLADWRSFERLLPAIGPTTDRQP